MSIYTGEGAWAPAYPYMTRTSLRRLWKSLYIHAKGSKNFRVSSGQPPKTFRNL